MDSHLTVHLKSQTLSIQPKLRKTNKHIMTATVASKSVQEIQQTQDNFKIFADLVNQQLLKMSSNELYKTEANNIFEAYLSFFPKGTNPIFRERTFHDCNCCKQFVRNLGTVVSIVDNKIVTVWDVENAPYPYDMIAKNMADYVRKNHIVNVYRTKMTQYGHEKNVANYDKNIIWRHFYGKVPSRSVKMDPGPELARYSAAYQVLNRGLQEFTLTDLEEVLDLIDQKSIYRGEEFRKSVVAFRELKTKYQKAKNKELFVWENVDHPQAGFRNTAIGSLFVDLAAGDDIEAAVKKFESKVAPHNYKRPTALITPKMIEQAISKLKELDLEDAVERRMAKIDDISVNDVLFVDNSVAGEMKGGLKDLLMTSSSVKNTTKVPKNPIKISIEDFIALKSKSIELIITNSHLSNFVTLTAPVHDDVKGLFKWENNFGWSYDGEVADSMRDLVVSRGGRVDGVFRFTHQWNYRERNASLMDLHVFMPGCNKYGHRDGCHDSYPNGQRVGWNKRNDYLSMGVQDVDYIDAAPEGYVPIENITFPDLNKMPEGKYVCKIHNWQLRQPTKGGFKAEIEFEGQVYEYEFDRPLKHEEWVTVAEVTLRNGKFSIEHKIPTTSSSKEKWGVKTQVPVKVNTIMLSPNHWEGTSKTGNKHWFFILENCLNPNPTRGIYNEFLNPVLEPHRKVFEVLGSKTKCPFSEEQLSGVGFSSTRKDTVIAIADKKAFEITF